MKTMKKLLAITAVCGIAQLYSAAPGSYGNGSAVARKRLNPNGMIPGETQGEPYLNPGKPGTLIAPESRNRPGDVMPSRKAATVFPVKRNSSESVSPATGNTIIQPDNYIKHRTVYEAVHSGNWIVGDYNKSHGIAQVDKVGKDGKPVVDKNGQSIVETYVDVIEKSFGSAVLVPKTDGKRKLIGYWIDYKKPATSKITNNQVYLYGILAKPTHKVPTVLTPANPSGNPVVGVKPTFETAVYSITGSGKWKGYTGNYDPITATAMLEKKSKKGTVGLAKGTNFKGVQEHNTLGALPKGAKVFATFPNPQFKQGMFGQPSVVTLYILPA